MFVDLVVYFCIVYQFGDGSFYVWEFNVDGKKIIYLFQGQWVFVDSYMEVKVVRFGLGLVYVLEELIIDDLVQGIFIWVFQCYSQCLEGLFFYYLYCNVLFVLRVVIDIL